MRGILGTAGPAWIALGLALLLVPRPADAGPTRAARGRVVGRKAATLVVPTPADLALRRHHDPSAPGADLAWPEVTIDEEDSSDGDPSTPAWTAGLLATPVLVPAGIVRLPALAGEDALAARRTIVLRC